MRLLNVYFGNDVYPYDDERFEPLPLFVARSRFYLVLSEEEANHHVYLQRTRETGIGARDRARVLSVDLHEHVLGAARGTTYFAYKRG